MNLPKLRNLIRDIKITAEDRRIQLIAVQQENLSLWRQNTELLSRVSRLYRHIPDYINPGTPNLRRIAICYDKKYFDMAYDKEAQVDALLADMRSKILSDINKSSSPF